MEELGGNTPSHAELLAEIQRLQHENEQRAAELAVINSVQHGLASEMNMQGIYEAVLLQTLVGTMSVALQNAGLFEEIQQCAAELDTVNTVSQQLSGKLDVDALIQLVGGQITNVFKADIA